MCLSKAHEEYFLQVSPLEICTRVYKCTACLRYFIWFNTEPNECYEIVINDTTIQPALRALIRVLKFESLVHDGTFYKLI